MLRAVATGSLERDPHLADIPTMAESGFPGFEAVSWFGLMAAVNTPRPIVERINAEVNRILADPQFREKLVEQGTLPGGGTPEAFGAFVSQEIKRWGEAAKIARVSASQ
jgi:tripartite-type tricarboxylate transporter receptor subunit TctC